MEEEREIKMNKEIERQRQKDRKKESTCMESLSLSKSSKSLHTYREV